MPFNFISSFVPSNLQKSPEKSAVKLCLLETKTFIGKKTITIDFKLFNFLHFLRANPRTEQNHLASTSSILKFQGLFGHI